MLLDDAGGEVVHIAFPGVDSAHPLVREALRDPARFLDWAYSLDDDPGLRNIELDGDVLTGREYMERCYPVERNRAVAVASWIVEATERGEPPPRPHPRLG